MQNNLPARKHPRLKGYDYSSNGAYFITLCVKDKREMLGKIVGRDALIAPSFSTNVPHIKLTQYGKVVSKHINKINSINTVVFVDSYVIMPNHIHMIIKIKQDDSGACENNIKIAENTGAMRTSRPTSTSISSIMRSFKTMITKELGFSLWQASYHDHIIRNEADYQRIWQYIDENPAKWVDDYYYVE